ncbi:hypothetical protein GCM10023174_13460 [Chelativorans composti]|uniref:Uncharacterized protein n=1 Tax=Chelativorans composti TaxID=768533 RepID=A0ABW5DEW6_9HYPH
MDRLARSALGLAILVPAVSVSMPGTAVTQAEICAPRAELAEQLEMQFAETQRAIGLLATDRLMEIFTSAEGSWTILSTDVNGVSCLIAAGEAWDDVSGARLVGEGV